MRIIQPLPVQDQTALDPAAPSRRNRFSVQRTAGTMPTWAPKGVEAANFADPSAANTLKVETGVTENQRPGFKDLLDMVNPLQHIPLVNVAYRKITGDEISAPAQFMGGMLFGGPIGAVAAMANIAMKERTGQSFGERAYAMIDRNSGQNTDQPVIKLAARWKDEPRMAGTMPVWGQDNAVAVAQIPPTVIPTGNISSQTNFAILLNDLSSDTHNIS